MLDVNRMICPSLLKLRHQVIKLSTKIPCSSFPPHHERSNSYHDAQPSPTRNEQLPPSLNGWPPLPMKGLLPCVRHFFPTLMNGPLSRWIVLLNFELCKLSYFTKSIWAQYNPWWPLMPRCLHAKRSSRVCCWLADSCSLCCLELSCAITENYWKLKYTECWI